MDFTFYFNWFGNYCDKLIKSKRWFHKINTYRFCAGAVRFSFYCVSIVFRTLSVGLVYAIWSGVGIVLTAIVAYFLFDQKIDGPGLLGIALIIAGVLVINLFSKTSH